MRSRQATITHRPYVDMLVLNDDCECAGGAESKGAGAGGEGPASGRSQAILDSITKNTAVVEAKLEAA